MNPTLTRLDYLDALRALALLAILLVHGMNRFSFDYPPAPRMVLDPFLIEVISEFLMHRAMFLFAFIFGISFYLQMSRSAARGVDFRGRFCWRLCLLGVFGVINLLFYRWDVLIQFALLGMPLAFIWKCSTRHLIYICLFFLSIILMFGFYPDFFPFLRDAAVGAPIAEPNLMKATFGEIATWNIVTAWPSKQFVALGGMDGVMLFFMFLSGLLVGRVRLLDLKRNRLPLLAAVLGILYYGVAIFFPKEEVVNLLIVISVFFFAAAMSWLLSRDCLHRMIYPLCCMGRCSLTCYLSQGMVMGILLYGWGFGQGLKMSVTQLVIACFLLYLGQIIFCMLWLRYFKYGPCEGVWRKLTNLSLH